MNSNQIIEKVCKAIDALITSGEKYNGLFPSMIDRDSNEMIMEFTPLNDGQREHDRTFLGSNLMHDHVVLKTIYAIGNVLNKKNYIEAADKYLKYFVSHCTNTVTGLFPWGEHAYWHLLEDKAAAGQDLKPDSTGGSKLVHDHLNQAPLWLWEKLYEFNPNVVIRFAKGLDMHWKSKHPYEYNRHAYINIKEPFKMKKTYWADFPRHGGFYIFDWAFAYRKTRDKEFYDQIITMLDYIPASKDKNGLLSYATNSIGRDELLKAPAQTLSLAASMLEAAEILYESNLELSIRLQKEAGEYLNGFFSVPHDNDEDVYVLSCRPETYEITGTMPIWSSKYGVPPAAYSGLICNCCYRITKDKRLLDYAKSVAISYVKKDFPDSLGIPALVCGLVLGLFADLYEISGEQNWLSEGLKLADIAIKVYLDKDLPRCATGIDIYESQMLPGFLLNGLARIALLSENRINCGIEPDYSYRQ
ncbi:MAG TPA: hypothetical protein PK733_03760 [Clostridiales bacterium]|nr:hypothetical protein [Clostridiales bacterium]